MKSKPKEKWSLEIISISKSDGGLKEVIASIREEIFIHR